MKRYINFVVKSKDLTLINMLNIFDKLVVNNKYKKLKISAFRTQEIKIKKKKALLFQIILIK